RHFWGVYALTTAVVLVGIISDGEDLPLIALPSNIIMLAAAWILGDNLRTRRNYLHELEEKAVRTEAQREAEARQAVSEERTRIARELHDVVAHSVSVMVVQAGAARRVLDQDPAQAADALTAIEATGRESLTEMRRVLGVLRSDDELVELAPIPSLDDFDRLLRQCEEAGLPVELEVEGEARPLAPGLELSAYRVVQESLTNSLKHAGPTQARVKLEYSNDSLVVKVSDDGRGAAAPTGKGQGLIGMRERVEAFDGDLTVGPKPGGGYSVTACFPTSAL
ncbi:MAG: sensor histidine kinase, partial [Actinomycetia bacterium]|nr:sensor histidine kinase [Actinomycetes bacterium]